MFSTVCPACGAPIQFKSRFSKTTVCSFCQSLLARKEDSVVYSGKIAKLAEDMSVLQIGTKGRFSAINFEIIGQIKINWSDGYWNEWYVLEESGAQAWISEAMGILNYVYEYKPPEDLNNPHSYDLNSIIALNDTDFSISDIKAFTVAGCLGELPFEIKQDLRGISFDLISEDDDCAFLEYYENYWRAFIGKNVEFESLNLTNIRVPDGW